MVAVGVGVQANEALIKWALPPPGTPAGNGEIDQGLFDLLQQNIDGARAAGQQQAAEFMEKVLVAAKRYSV